MIAGSSRAPVSFRVAAAVLTAALSLFAAEIAFRIVDGYTFAPRLFRARPKPPSVATSSNRKWVDSVDAEYYVRRLPAATGIDRAWFQLDPPAPQKQPIRADIERRFKANRGFELSSVYEWNAEYLRRALCTDARLRMQVFSHIDDLLVFQPSDGQPYPPFRFLRNTHYPSGLQTNTFGWRGPDIALNKPPHTVRIAFVGASTTVDPHGDRFSYPEYVGTWLNEWARHRATPVRFEIINAGREGIDAMSAGAIVEQELVPLQPDLVVDYEGANQFWPVNFIDETLPERPLESARPPSALEQHSALAVRIRDGWNRLHEGREPKKPALRVRWPTDLDEQDPPLDDPRLPVDLPVTLRAMDRMRTALAGYGGTLVPSSFVFLVSADLVLDRARDAGVYSFLNETLWPFRYAHIRRYADFQNRVFRKYATVHELPFNDLASVYPADPRLFQDILHMTPAGIKLKAWLVLQQIAPEIERRLSDGRLPRADPGGRTVHPAFAGPPPTLVRLADVRNTCVAPTVH